MDEEVYHWITIIMLFIILLLVGFKAVQQEQPAIKFLMEQCLTETSANLTWKGGTYTIQAVDNTCIIKETIGP